MAHDHGFAFRMVVLKTLQGYLTKSGFTKDVTSKDVLTVSACELGGKWAPKYARIERFKKHFGIYIEIKENECEFFTYAASDQFRKNPSKWY